MSARIAGMPDLQGVYDHSGGASPLIGLLGAVGGLVLRDNVAPIGGDLFAVQDSGGDSVFAVQAARLHFGHHSTLLSGGGPEVMVRLNSDTSNTFEFWPTDRTFTSSPGALMRLALVTHIHDYANVSLSMLSLQHTSEHKQSGFVFNHGLIFNHGTTYQNTLNVAADYGPLQGFIDQPSLNVNRTTPGTISQSLFRSFLSQPRFGRASTSGTLAVTNIGQFQAFGQFAVGSSITNWTRFVVGPFSGGGGSITNYRGIDIFNETLGTITNQTGVRIQTSASGAGTRRAIEHIGTALSTFAGPIHMNNAVATVYGSVASSGIEVRRSSVGVLRMVGIGGTNNEGLDWDFDAVANVVGLSSSTGAALRINNRLDVNNGQALGGGAAPTLGTIGGAGPTAAAQAQWLEVDINGVAHWIPVWT